MFQRRGSRIRDTLLLSGWLFADLLLALMMIFLISINGGQAPPKPCATPTTGAAATTAINALSLARLSEGPIVPFRSQSNQPGGSGGTTPPFATPTPCPMPTSTQTPTPTPVICGLDLKNPVDITFPVNDPDGLRAETPSGQQNFDSQVQSEFASDAKKTAGLVEVFGGGQDVGTGEAFAQNAIDALGLLENQGFVFDSERTVFQNYWDGHIGNDNIRMYVLFYQQSETGKCA